MELCRPERVDQTFDSSFFFFFTAARLRARKNAATIGLGTYPGVSGLASRRRRPARVCSPRSGARGVEDPGELEGSRTARCSLYLRFRGDRRPVFADEIE